MAKLFDVAANPQSPTEEIVRQRHRSFLNAAVPFQGYLQPLRLTRVERVLLKRLVRTSCPVSVRVIFGKDEEIVAGEPPVSHTIIIRTRTALCQLLRHRVTGFLNGYTAGTIEIDGDLIELLNHFQRRFSLHPEPPAEIFSTIKSFFRRRQTLKSQDNVTRHYDVGNDFYRIWLDEEMVYTCAYFEQENQGLEEAQRAKIDYVCRKLRLGENDQVVEAGCGWGALALYMARRYGAQVRAFNLSDEQLEFARARAVQMQLQNRVEFIKGDWREIRGTCDAFVSVGMLEHVGPENLRLLGKLIRKSLGRGGRGLIHSIGQNTVEPLCPWIEQRIFPGAQPPTLKQMMEIFEPDNLSVLDVENLRPHYALTLRHWLRRYDHQAESIRQMFDTNFERLWRIYLASSASAFETGSLQLYQVLFAPIGSSFFPMTRSALYQG